MEIEFYGANCFKITTKKATVVIDDNLDKLGAKSVTKADNILLSTFAQELPKAEIKLHIDVPGEYEVSGVSIMGVAARSHMDEPNHNSSTMFKVIADDIRIAVVGHVYPELKDTELEALGTVDVLLIPVGNSGYTLDGLGALKLIKKIEPKIVIPSHYADSKLKYEVPQQSLSDALKDLAMEPKAHEAKLKLKPADLSGIEGTQLIVLDRQ